MSRRFFLTLVTLVLSLFCLGCEDLGVLEDYFRSIEDYANAQEIGLSCYLETDVDHALVFIAGQDQELTFRCDTGAEAMLVKDVQFYFGGGFDSLGSAELSYLDDQGNQDVRSTLVSGNGIVRFQVTNFFIPANDSREMTVVFTAVGSALPSYKASLNDVRLDGNSVDSGEPFGELGILGWIALTLEMYDNFPTFLEDPTSPSGDLALGTEVEIARFTVCDHAAATEGLAFVAGDYVDFTFATSHADCGPGEGVDTVSVSRLGVLDPFAEAQVDLCDPGVRARFEHSFMWSLVQGQCETIVVHADTTRFTESDDRVRVCRPAAGASPEAPFTWDYDGTAFGATPAIADEQACGNTMTRP